ncbi:MAG TPA: SpoIIE family protein phosphatase [Candidatus Acidoferrales bacterium]|nr:SpoIIE family protein phosphatase [Candidatus Acidoferrales bacterium]
METLFDTLNEGVLVADDCNHILYINSCLSEMLDNPASEVVGRTAAHFYSQDEYNVILTQQARNLEQNRFEFVLPRRDGARMPVVVSVRRLEDPDGREFAIITFTDISEQKRAEAALREANALLGKRHEEIEEDLTLAARVQQSLAPDSLVWGGTRVEGYFQPVRTIGGDFGLVSPINGRLNLLVCDVSGHGIGSALLANRIYTETMFLLQANSPLDDMLRDLNRFFLETIGRAVFFFTIAAIRVDYGGRRMQFAGAGHPPALLVSPGKEPERIESRSTLLGALGNAVSNEAVIDVELAPGDRVVLYTDGITDVFDSRGEMLGVEGVQKFVRETSSLPLAEMKQEILDRVAQWREGPPTDDISMVLLEVT